MKFAVAYRRLITSFGFISATFILSACGGSGGGDASTPTNNNPPAISSKSSVSSQASSAVSTAFSSAPTTPSNKPSMPTSLQATAIYSTQVSLTWAKSSSVNPVTSYRLTRNGVVIGTTEGAVERFTDTGLNPENQYTYRVQGGDAQGNWSSLSMGLSIRTAPPGNDPEVVPEPPASSSRSSASSRSTSSRSSSSNSSAPSSSAPGNTAPDVTAPSRPSGLSAVSVKNTSIDLVWTAASDDVGVTLYSVTRNGEVVGSVSGQSQAFLDMDLTPNTEYNYTIQAVDAAGNWSLSSANFFAKTTDKAQQGTDLSWSHPTERENGEYLELNDIGGYELRYRQNSLDTFKYIVVNGSQTTTYSLGSLASDNDYQIAVYDINGLYSNYVPISPQ